MSALQVGSSVEVWERRGQSDRRCYVGVITAADERFFQVRQHPESVTAVSFYREGRMLQYDNGRRYLKAVQS